MISNNLYIRYFMFSNEHLNKIKELAIKNGNMNPKLGKVLVSGNFKKYTMLTNDPESYRKRYSDARIVMSGDIRKIKYEPEE